jgi:hypothetical protein
MTHIHCGHSMVKNWETSWSYGYLQDTTNWQRTRGPNQKACHQHSINHSHLRACVKFLCTLTDFMKSWMLMSIWPSHRKPAMAKARASCTNGFGMKQMILTQLVHPSATQQRSLIKRIKTLLHINQATTHGLEILLWSHDQPNHYWSQCRATIMRIYDTFHPNN